MAQAELQLYIDNLESTLGASSSDFLAYYDAFPGEDPLTLTSQVMCSGSNVGDVISDQNSTETALCKLPTDVNPTGCGSLGVVHDETKRDTSSFRLATLNETFLLDHISKVLLNKRAEAHVKEARVLSPSEDQSIVGPGQQPSYAALMNAVMSDEMTFQYTRLVQIGDSSAAFDNMMGPTSQQQGILEVAWLMGTGNNVANLNSNYQEVGGTDLTARPAPDSFFVMHFHIDHVLTDGGDAYLGIYAYNAWHGQYINGQNRVDGNSVTTGSMRNLRTHLVECPGYGGPTGNNQYVYPGYEVDGSQIDSVFLNYLSAQGILTRAAVEDVSSLFLIYLYFPSNCPPRL